MNNNKRNTSGRGFHEAATMTAATAASRVANVGRDPQLDKEIHEVLEAWRSVQGFFGQSQDLIRS